MSLSTSKWELSDQIWRGIQEAFTLYAFVCIWQWHFTFMCLFYTSLAPPLPLCATSHYCTFFSVFYCRSSPLSPCLLLHYSFPEHLLTAWRIVIIPCHVHCTMGSFSPEILNPFAFSVFLLSLFHFICLRRKKWVLKKSPEEEEVCFCLNISSSASRPHKNEYFLLATLHERWKLSLGDAIRYIFICLLSVGFISTDRFQSKCDLFSVIRERKTSGGLSSCHKNKRSGYCPGPCGTWLLDTILYITASGEVIFDFVLSVLMGVYEICSE